MTDFESYERFTLLIGIIVWIGAYLPLFLFLYPIYLPLTSAEKTILYNDHLVYFIAWLWSAGAHLLLLAPWNWAWIVLFLLKDEPYEGKWYSFYSFWLRSIIKTFFPWVIVVTTGLWIATIVVDYNNEDDVFLVVYPGIALMVYILFAPITYILIAQNWEDAIKYFDSDERALAEQKQIESDGPQIIGTLGDVTKEEEAANSEADAAAAGSEDTSEPDPSTGEANGFTPQDALTLMIQL